MQRNFEEYKSRRDFIIDRLNRIPGVYSPMPQGAFYTLARLPVEDADALCLVFIRFPVRGANTFHGTGIRLLRDTGVRKKRSTTGVCS